MLKPDAARSIPPAGAPVITRYSTVAVVLHWAIAILLILNILVAWWAEGLAGADRGVAMGFHKSTGILILILSLIRVGWRVAHPAPPYPAGLKAWERVSARAVHLGFYFVMIAMPVTGWIMASGGKRPLDFYGLFAWPKLGFVTGAPEFWRTIGDTHGLIAWLAYLLILLHVGASVKHQFIDKDVIMARMAPFLRRR